MFRKPRQQTLKADQTSRISRCSVCIRHSPLSPQQIQQPPAQSQYFYPANEINANPNYYHFEQEGPPYYNNPQYRRRNQRHRKQRKHVLVN